MSDPKPTERQRAALKDAIDCAFLHRLPGGYWVRNTVTTHAATDAWHGTQTIETCYKRGWLAKTNNRDPLFKAKLCITTRGVEALNA